MNGVKLIDRLDDLKNVMYDPEDRFVFGTYNNRPFGFELAKACRFIIIGEVVGKYFPTADHVMFFFDGMGKEVFLAILNYYGITGTIEKNNNYISFETDYDNALFLLYFNDYGVQISSLF